MARRPEVAPEVSVALADLDRLARERPELEPGARTLADLLPAAFGGAAAVRWDRASGAPPGFDAADVRRRTLAVLERLEGTHAEAGTLARAVRTGAFDVVAWLVAHLTDASTPTSPAEDTGLVASVGRLVALPALAAATRGEPVGPTAGAACPRCGLGAALAEARGLEQHRLLRCGWCAGAWAMPRLGCAGCGACAAGDVVRYHVEGEGERAHMVACRRCGLRVRVVATLAPLTPPGLLVAELATVHLEYLEPPEARRPAE
jgi:hypothetical protein